MGQKLDKISDITGTISAWMFFAIGVFIAWEVLMRYLFTAPTIWVDEISRILQIWATCLGGTYLLRHRHHIVIDVFFRDNTTIARRILETFSLILIALFCGVTAKFGFDLWLKATLAGHTTDSYLAPPKWLTHSSIWVGFGLMLLQCCVEIVRVWVDGIPPSTNHPTPDHKGD